jgi:hypothetical protein
VPEKVCEKYARLVRGAVPGFGEGTLSSSVFYGQDGKRSGQMSNGEWLGSGRTTETIGGTLMLLVAVVMSLRLLGMLLTVI